MLNFVLGLLGLIFIFLLGLVLGLGLIAWAARHGEMKEGLGVVKCIVDMMPYEGKVNLRDQLDCELDDWMR